MCKVVDDHGDAESESLQNNVRDSEGWATSFSLKLLTKPDLRFTYFMTFSRKTTVRNILNNGRETNFSIFHFSMIFKLLESNLFFIFKSL